MDPNLNDLLKAGGISLADLRSADPDALSRQLAEVNKQQGIMTSPPTADQIRKAQQEADESGPLSGDEGTPPWPDERVSINDMWRLPGDESTPPWSR